MELTEELESMAETDSVRRRNVRTKSSFTLALLGWLIIGSTLNSIIFASFPLRLAAAEWQLSLIASILSAGFNLLIGATLIIVAQMFNTRESTLKRWQLTVSRIASWFVIFLILIIPVQFFLGSRVLKQQAIPPTEAINNLKGIVNKISAINSEPELRAFVASLPNPPTLPDKFDAPFPVIKQRAIVNTNAQINAATNNLTVQKSQAMQLFLKEAVRNTSQAILMAAAFSIFANLSVKTTNPITRLFNSFI
jgi:cytochrome b561